MSACAHPFVNRSSTFAASWRFALSAQTFREAEQRAGIVGIAFQSRRDKPPLPARAVCSRAVRRRAFRAPDNTTKAARRTRGHPACGPPRCNRESPAHDRRARSRCAPPRICDASLVIAAAVVARTDREVAGHAGGARVEGLALRPRRRQVFLWRRMRGRARNATSRWCMANSLGGAGSARISSQAPNRAIAKYSFGHITSAIGIALTTSIGTASLRSRAVLSESRLRPSIISA